MSCDLVESSLDLYVDRELEPAAAAEVRAHLDGCPACRGRVAERETLGRLVRLAPYHSAPDRLRERVLAGHARTRSIRQVLT